MAVAVRVPWLGMSMTERVPTEWLAAGGAIQEAMAFYAPEYDKSTQEVEGPASGILHLIAEIGETCAAGALIATID